MSFKEAQQKVKMLRVAPAIYNRRRLLERPIPEVPATNQVQAPTQNDSNSRSTPHRGRSTSLNDAVEIQNTNQSASEPASSINSEPMPQNTSVSTPGEAVDAINQTVPTTNASKVPTTPALDNVHHEQTSETEMVTERDSEAMDLTSQTESNLDSVLAIAASLANAVSVNAAIASQQMIDKSKSVVSGSRDMNTANSNMSSENISTNTGYLQGSDAGQASPMVLAEDLNAPGCSHWTDSEAVLQSRLNARLEQADAQMTDVEPQAYDASLLHEAEYKPEMVPLHEISTENVNEIFSILEASTEECEEMIVFEETAKFDGKRENDIISGNIPFNETVSVLSLFLFFTQCEA